MIGRIAPYAMRNSNTQNPKFSSTDRGDGRGVMSFKGLTILIFV